jgi:hypothetical protein
MLKIVKDFLTEFSEKYGISQAGIERVLDLPQHSLDKEKGSEVVALIKMIKTFPWLISVAEKNYDRKEAKRTLLHVAVDYLIDLQDSKKEQDHASCRQGSKKGTKTGKANDTNAKVGSSKSKNQS